MPLPTVAGLPSNGLGGRDAGARIARRAPGDEIVELHHAADPQFGGDGIIESRRPRQIVGAHGDIADHLASPLAMA
jgi:hypothetical protein